MLAYQAPHAFMQGLAGILILRSKRRRPLDLALLAMFVFNALQFLSKPFLAVATGGPGASPQQYIASDYAGRGLLAGRPRRKCRPDRADPAGLADGGRRVAWIRRAEGGGAPSAWRTTTLS